jgi:hypothetical protein
MKASLPKNTEYLFKKVNDYLFHSSQWFWETPERALLVAYKAAVTIKNIEIEQFGGNPISAELGNYTESVMAYWESELERNLTTIKVRLVEFKVSRSLLNISNPSLLEKLSFIDEVLNNYVSIEPNIPEVVPVYKVTGINKVNNESESEEAPINRMRKDSFTEKTGLFPRSIGRTINRVKTELDPKSEEEVVRNFRNSTKQTRKALRFLLLLVIVPVLTQQLSKNFVVTPILDIARGEQETQIFINSEMEEKALKELQNYEKSLRFQSLIYQTPELSRKAIEEKVKHKASELAEEFRFESRNAISNVFADMIALGAFALLIVTGKQEIAVLKSFMDTVVYGLSDSAKAFIIILFTDIFVGFHSPHGWEVIIEGLAAHLGIAPSRSFIFLFIATFPVVLDTILKYWIFRYMSRISPSAVATLKSMNE